MLPICNLLLILSNPCNLTSIFPQIPSNGNGTFNLQNSACNCSCTNFPNLFNMCGLNATTIPPCTTPAISTTEAIDNEATSLSPTSSSVVNTTPSVISSEEITQSPPESSDQRKDNEVTTEVSTKDDDINVHSTPSVTPSEPAQETSNSTPASITLNDVESSSTKASVTETEDEGDDQMFNDQARHKKKPQPSSTTPLSITSASEENTEERNSPTSSTSPSPSADVSTESTSSSYPEFRAAEDLGELGEVLNTTEQPESEVTVTKSVSRGDQPSSSSSDPDFQVSTTESYDTTTVIIPRSTTIVYDHSSLPPVNANLTEDESITSTTQSPSVEASTSPSDDEIITGKSEETTVKNDFSSTSSSVVSSTVPSMATDASEERNTEISSTLEVTTVENKAEVGSSTEKSSTESEQQNSSVDEAASTFGASEKSADENIEATTVSIFEASTRTEDVEVTEHEERFSQSSTARTTTVEEESQSTLDDIRSTDESEKHELLTTTTTSESVNEEEFLQDNPTTPSEITSSSTRPCRRRKNRYRTSTADYSNGESNSESNSDDCDESTSPISSTTQSTIYEEYQTTLSASEKYINSNAAPNLLITSTAGPLITTLKASITDEATTTPANEIKTTSEGSDDYDDRMYNDQARKKKTTTQIATTIEPGTTVPPYPTERIITTEESNDPITTTTPEITTMPIITSTAEVESTTKPSNESDCNLADPPKEKADSLVAPLEKQALRRVKRGLFGYGLELSKAVLQNDTSNVAISPISFALVLALARTGSRSPMKEEIDKILRLPPHMHVNRLKIFRNIVGSLNNISDIDNVEMHMAYNMYLTDDVDISPKFQKLAQVIFQADPQLVDFENLAPAVKQLNSWSANSTDSKICEFTDKSHMDDKTSILLASVAYFSGNWSKPFEKFLTSGNEFDVGNDTKKRVCTMLQVNKFRYGYLPHLGANFVELPYEFGDKGLAMIVMVPAEGETLDNVVENLPKLRYADLYTFSSSEVVELSLPKFKIQNSIDLAENSEEFGLSNITSYSNEFRCICNVQPLQISHILQKAVIDVHEGGCKPVAPYVCPEVEQKCNNSSVKFTVNRPFIILVVNSDMVLFSGRVNDPTL